MRVGTAGFLCWGILSLLAVSRLAAAAEDHRLADAVKARNSTAARALLARGVDVNAPQPDGATALHWAAHWNDLATAELLIRAGARVNATNDYGMTPLLLASMNGSAKMIVRLLKAGADANTTFPTGETALMKAASTGDVDAVMALLEAGANVNAIAGSQGQTALMWAAGEGYAEVTSLLIGRGADIHARSKNGYTPLLFAARVGDRETTKVLLASGADVNERSKDGSTALVVATIRGRTDYARFLLEQGANPNLGPGFTPLHWAVGEWGEVVQAADTEWSGLGGLRGQARLDFIKLLLSHGANVNAVAENSPRAETGGKPGGDLIGGTPFLMAAKATAVDVMRLLLTSGADPLKATTNKTTPLMYAAGIGHNTPSPDTEITEALEAVKLCVELGADVNAVNTAGETALHGATYRGGDTIARFLAEKGAKLNVKNKKGWTPLVIAEGIAFAATNTRSDKTAAALRALGAEPSPPNIERNALAVAAAPAER